MIGIDLAASLSVAQDNSVALPFGRDAHIGIRIAGADTQAVNNTDLRLWCRRPIGHGAAWHADRRARLGRYDGAHQRPRAR